MVENYRVITCTGSWLFPAETWPANPVSWTVNTLFFFYLVFPFILPRVLTAENIAEFPCGDYEFKRYVFVSFFPSQILYV
jgi:peptidoglycan/LPS O-acetylase OafA/YrhL